jgi:hypothetical protein
MKYFISLRPDEVKPTVQASMARADEWIALSAQKPLNHPIVDMLA